MMRRARASAARVLAETVLPTMSSAARIGMPPSSSMPVVR
jgi:hypothetical protein